MSRVLKLTLVGLFLAVTAILAVIMLATDWGSSPIFRTTSAATPEDHSYVVSMSPMGDVHFNHVPQHIVTLDANYNDMLVALGEESHLLATGYQGNFYDGFYGELSGVNVALNPAKLTYIAHAGGGMIDKELLYSLHADIFHIDPVQLATSRGWTRADVDEIARNVAPFFANRFSRDNAYGGKEPYTFYTLWELSEKVGEVYRRPERIAQLKLVYDQLVHDIQAKLPPLEMRPRIGLIFYSNGKFVPYSLLRGGFGQAQYRDVGARDAFAGIEGSTYGAGEKSAPLDLEGLLAINPDVLIMPFAIYPASSSSTSRASYEQLLKLKDDPLAQRLTAFHDHQIYPGGTPLQGPIFYLFQIEMAAKQIYPKIFGPYRDDQNYPASEQLFDRARVAEILKGNGADGPDHP
jgi:ABC-type Fe3+-hydroxamate transport system substrate-binding protein